MSINTQFFIGLILGVVACDYVSIRIRAVWSDRQAQKAWRASRIEASRALMYENHNQPQQPANLNYEKLPSEPKKRLKKFSELKK